MDLNIDQYHQQGAISDYFYDKIKDAPIMGLLDEEDAGGYLADIVQMSSMGVESPEDELHMRRIQNDVPDVIRDIVSNDFQLSPDVMDSLYRELYFNKEKYDLSNILQVFCSVAAAAKAVDIPLSEEALSSCHLNKTAYPQGFAGDHQKPAYDISKWMQATKDIYSRMRRTGKPYFQALNEVTAKWDKMEKLDYKHWLKYYNEGADKKYPKLATAADYHSDNGFVLPMAQLPLPIKEQEKEEDKKPKVDENQVRDSIEMHRKKILGRLSAAERLLASLEGQSFAGNDQELMLKLLQDLKRKVMTANKISIKSALFEDLIYRAGNFMKEAHASNRGRDFFYKIAQAPLPMDPFAGATAPAGSPGGQGISEDEAWARFFARYEDGLYDEDDKEEFEKSKKKDKPQQAQQPQQGTGAAPGAPTATPATPPEGPGAGAAPAGPGVPPGPDALPPVPPKAATNEPDIIVTAQDIGAPADEEINIGEAEAAPPEDKPQQQRERLAPEPEADITVTEEEVVGPEDNTDDIIDEALEQVDVQDAINLLEMLVSIYKQREVPRQLSKLDMVMDRLGLAAYFPQLGEAQSKALESTQYVSTRLEDILAKLKGSVQSSEAESWVEKEKTIDPQTQAVQKDLQNKQDKEEKRKEMRKQKSDAKLEGGGGGAPGVGQQAQQELAQPTPVETGRAVPVR